MSFGPAPAPPKRNPAGNAGAAGRPPNGAAGAGAKPVVRKPAAPKPPWNPNFADDKPAAPAAADKAGGYVKESLSATLPKYRKTVHVGDRVKDRHSGRVGTAMYVGAADFSRGKEVCGLRLDIKRTTTDCDGKYRGERYFRCTPGHGLYIPLDDAEFIGVANDEDIVKDAVPAVQKRASEVAAADGPGLDVDFDLEKELEQVVGLASVKEMLRSLRNAIEVRKRRSEYGVNDSRTMHMLFLGNPGTGKTTVARLVSRMMHHLGVLKKGHLIEVTRKDLIGSHHGETGHLTADACKRAVGGVLFIDEAYALRHEGSSDSAGQECVNTLVKESEDRAGELVIILAGYQKEMTTFLSTNSGLTSRFPNVFAFADYSFEEMAEICTNMTISRGFELAEDLHGDRLVQLVQRCIKAGEVSKGNGRLVRNMVEAAVARQTDRVFGMGTVSRGTLTTLIEEDFEPPPMVDSDDSVQTVLAKLDKVVGLSGVKLYVKQLMAQLQLQIERKEAGLPSSSSDSLHMLFIGNPGTGKTTVARIIAQMFKALKVLRLGHLVEVDRSGLVAGFAGQTAIKTRQVVEGALGGLLFVDEAYAIVADERDHFGKEALDTLIKLTEDYRDDLVVVMAGYPDEMKRLCAANPGIRSRFPSTIEFADYGADELMAIADGMLKDEHMELEAEAREILAKIFAQMAQVHERENGNGRAVRNLLERAKRAQALRLMGVEGRKSRADLVLLRAEDFAEFVLPPVPGHP